MSKTIYERYGGFAEFRKVISDFYDRILDSDSLQKYFENVDIRRLIDHQTKFIAYITGGPASFTDEHLSRAHKAHAISQEDFAEMNEILEDTLLDHDFDPEDVAYVVSEFAKRASLIVSR